MRKSAIAVISVVTVMLAWVAFCLVSNWKSVQREDSLNGYLLALTSPISAQGQEKLDWLAADKQDSLQGYAEFVSRHPNSKYRADVSARTGPRILPAIQNLTEKLSRKSDVHWTDEDRNLNQSILMLDPNNVFALYLSGLDEAWEGNSDKAREAFRKAKARATSENVSDVGHVCMVGKILMVGDAPISSGTRRLVIVLPAWQGEQAGAERSRIMAELKTHEERYHGQAVYVMPGVCIPQLIYDAKDSHPDSPLRTLAFWIDEDLRTLSHP